MNISRSSRRRGLFAAATSALAVLLLPAAFSSTAGARPGRTTAVVPNGMYGVNVPARGEYLVFEVRNRRISNLAFQIQILCQASDSPVAEPRFFSSSAMPQPRVIPQNGRFHLEWEERGEGRVGRIGLNMTFGTRDIADITVNAPEFLQDPPVEPGEARESCDGSGILHFRRGYEVSPLPTTP